MGKVILPETVISLYRSEWGTESGEIVTFGTGTVPSVDITPGKKYVVTHDGVDYVIEAVDLEVEGTHFDCLGDYPITTTRSVPFLYASVYEYGYSLFHDYKNTGGSTTIKISEYDESAETEPISLDPISMTLGWLVGQRIAGQRGNKPKEPIAYLYNGVQLPKLPEWDREKYPYVFMFRDEGASSYDVIAAQSVEYAYNGAKFAIDPQGEYYWYYCEDGSDTWEFYAYTANPFAALLESIMWANFDVLGEDGTTYLAASEPIPVYE